MKRRFVLLLAVSLVIVVVAVPCLAADIDYNDFVYNIDSDGESDIVSVSIPVSFVIASIMVRHCDCSVIIATTSFSG